MGNHPPTLPIHPLTALLRISFVVVFTIAPFAASAQLRAPLALQSSQDAPVGSHAKSFALTIPAFPNGGVIPPKYTCNGANLSPALSWTDAPARTQSFALIADDPDAPAGNWTHWILWNIPATVTSLPEGMPRLGESGDGSRQGNTSFKRIGYGGPCPPPGKPHRYFFKLYALDAKPGLAPGATRSEFEHAIKGHILAQAEFMGTYGR